MPDRRGRQQKQKDTRSRERPSSNRRAASTQEKQALSTEHENMLKWLKTVRFKKAVMGGVSEQDVWKKLEELNNLYEAALVSERARYDTLLNAYTQNAKSKIASYQKAVKSLQAENEALKLSMQDDTSSD